MTKKKPLITLRGDLKQRDVTAYEMELSQVPLPAHLFRIPSSSAYRAAALKAAIGAGWVEAPECKKREVHEDGKEVIEYMFDGVDVDDLEPATAYKAGSAVLELYDGFTRLDPT